MPSARTARAFVIRSSAQLQSGAPGRRATQSLPGGMPSSRYEFDERHHVGNGAEIGKTYDYYAAPRERGEIKPDGGARFRGVHVGQLSVPERRAGDHRLVRAEKLQIRNGRGDCSIEFCHATAAKLPGGHETVVIDQRGGTPDHSRTNVDAPFAHIDTFCRHPIHAGRQKQISSRRRSGAGSRERSRSCAPPCCNSG